ncbi:MAG: hypothetical protein KTR28_02245, partial [Micavibrio sp.]|nr:hypothetical protein [Micavibrio sp.]
TKAGPLPTVALAPALNTALNVPPAQTFASISPQAGKGGLLTAQTQMQVPQIHFLQIQNPQGEQLTQNLIFNFQGAELKIKNLIQMGYISPKQDTAIQPPESIKPLQQTLGNINADRPIKALTGQAEAKGFFAKLITPPTTEGLLTTESTPLFAPLKTMDVRINGITPPKMVVKNIAQSQAQNQILGNFKAGQIEGVVTGLSEAKLPQLSLFLPQTGETAMFDLQKPALDGVTIGARLQVTPQNSGLSALSAPSSSPDLMPLPALTAPSSSWPILDEVQQTLAHIVPQAAAAMANTVPSPASPAQMMPAMMFFISAVRGGDLQSWLGEKSVEALSKSSKGLLERLSGESSTLSRVASDSAQGDWRIFNIPIMYQEQIQKMALYYRHEDSEDTDAPKGAKGTRFVFDLALDNMGAVQVDGLFRPISSDGKRLDLVVRTETPFSKATRAEMRRVYTLALRHTEVGGELSFQNQSSQWVSVGIAPDAGLGVNA